MLLAVTNRPRVVVIVQTDRILFWKRDSSYFFNRATFAFNGFPWYIQIKNKRSNMVLISFELSRKNFCIYVRSKIDEFIVFPLSLSLSFDLLNLRNNEPRTARRFTHRCFVSSRVELKPTYNRDPFSSLSLSLQRVSFLSSSLGPASRYFRPWREKILSSRANSFHRYFPLIDFLTFPRSINSIPPSTNSISIERFHARLFRLRFERKLVPPYPHYIS